MKSTLIVIVLAGLCSCMCLPMKRSSAPATAAAHEPMPRYKVIPLRYASADALATSLRKAVVAKDRRRQPQFVADERTNSVIVTCTAEELPPIEQLIAELDTQVTKP